MSGLSHSNIARMRSVHPLANSALCVVLDYY